MSDIIFATSRWKIAARQDGFFYAYKGSTERMRIGSDGCFSFGNSSETIDEEYQFLSNWGASTFVKLIEPMEIMEMDLKKICLSDFEIGYIGKRMK